MNINALELCRLKLDLAKSKDGAFDPDNYYWVMGDDVRKEITRAHGANYDPFTGDVPKLKVLMDIKVEAYGHVYNGVVELKKKLPHYYITTASRPDDDWVMKMLKDQLNMQYGAQPGRGGFTYFKPRFKLAEPEEGINFEFTPSPAIMNYIQNDILAIRELHERRRKERMVPEIDRVIYNNPATIVFWKDGTKTVVKAQDEAFDEEKGLAMAIAKKVYGNEGNYFDKLKKHLPKIEKKPAKKPKTRKKSNKK